MSLQNTIRRILKEETRKPYKIMRRGYDIDYEVDRILSKPHLKYAGFGICKKYKSADEFITSIQEQVMENMYFHTFYMMDDTSDEWQGIVDFIYIYIRDNLTEKLTNHYNNLCKPNVS